MNKPSSPRTTGRPFFPEGYGIPEHNNGLLPWEYVEQRMKEAKNYWVATASTQGKPSVTPVWGAWVDGRFYFDGAPTTRRGRNIAGNKYTAVHLESGDRVVILEGETVILSEAPDRDLAERVAGAYREKYADQGYSPAAEQWDQGGLFVFTPKKAMAWTKFPDDVTRWVIR